MGMHVYLFKIDPDGGKYIQKFKKKKKPNKSILSPKEFQALKYFVCISPNGAALCNTHSPIRK